jgi:hypothetical protein
MSLAMSPPQKFARSPINILNGREQTTLKRDCLHLQNVHIKFKENPSISPEVVVTRIRMREEGAQTDKAEHEDTIFRIEHM